MSALCWANAIFLADTRLFVSNGLLGVIVGGLLQGISSYFPCVNQNIHA